MPTIEKTLSNLAPNTFDPNHPSRQSTWFSYVRTVYSREHSGTIVSPTKTEFVRAWNSYDLEFKFRCTGNSLEDMKISLSRNVFPACINLSRRQRVSAETIAFTRIIMAFNMYAEVCKELGITLISNNRIDFIGSKRMRDAHIRTMFNNRKIIFINNEKLQSLIESSSTLSHNSCFIERFWNGIFDLYNNVYVSRTGRGFTRTQSITMPDNNIEIPEPTPEPVVSYVDNPTHSIAQEYIERLEDENEYVPSNHQIAEMILNSSDLPENLKKEIYETCMAFYISHPIT